MRPAFAVAALALLVACATPGSDEARVYGSPKKMGPTDLSSEEVRTVETQVSRTREDPGSAEFRRIRAAKLTFRDGLVTKGVCGQVDSRLSTGETTGYQAFRGYFDEAGVFVVLEVGGLAPGSCKTQFGISLK